MKKQMNKIDAVALICAASIFLIIILIEGEYASFSWKREIEAPKKETPKPIKSDPDSSPHVEIIDDATGAGLGTVNIESEGELGFDFGRPDPMHDIIRNTLKKAHDDGCNTSEMEKLLDYIVKNYLGDILEGTETDQVLIDMYKKEIREHLPHLFGKSQKEK